MLIDFKVQNYTSFNTQQELNMTASAREENASNVTASINKFGIQQVLKSAAIFGANGSGKTNLIGALNVFQGIVLGSLTSVGESAIRKVVPFFIKEDNFDVPTEFEITFLNKDILFRYGIAISKAEIVEEWLYWTKASRETQLFHRENQNITFNNRSFGEAKLFTKSQGDKLFVEKTKPFVPFISVLSQFDGEISTLVTDWFKKLNVISGLRDTGFKNYTIKLFESNLDFKNWALEILKSIQINDVSVVEQEIEFPLKEKRKKTKDKTLDELFEKLEVIYEKNNFKEKKIELIKLDSKNNRYVLPLDIESQGTQKLIYLLGPIYEVIKSDEILVVDEFDNRFHTLLCKFIIELFNKLNSGSSQLIITCHDTNLLSKDLFRRDQIWFIEKNEKHESELYSLLEYKEHYTRKENSYSRDYLQGKYGAIPLFSSLETLEGLLIG